MWLSHLCGHQLADDQRPVIGAVVARAPELVLVADGVAAGVAVAREAGRACVREQRAQRRGMDVLEDLLAEARREVLTRQTIIVPRRSSRRGVSV